jgi:hypothetical protein
MYKYVVKFPQEIEPYCSYLHLKLVASGGIAVLLAALNIGFSSGGFSYIGSQNSVAKVMPQDTLYNSRNE